MKERFNLFKGIDSKEIIRVKNLVPGALVYKGVTESSFQIELIEYSDTAYAANVFNTTSQLEAFISGPLRKQDVIQWVNITGINNIKEISHLGDLFGLNKLLLEQVLNITSYSSYYYDEDYIFSDVQMIYRDKENVRTDNVSIYTEGNLVVTFLEKSNEVFNPLKARISGAKGHVRSFSSTFLYYSILDVLVDNYLDVMESVKASILRLEEDVVNEVALDIKTIHENRKKLLQFKLAVGPIEKLIEEMRMDPRFRFGETEDAYLHNLHSHVREIFSELQLQQETINVLYENYMLNNSNEMNSIMTTLTLFSAIFIPLSFFTGLFGMNFRYIPGLEAPMAFYYFIGGGLSLIIGMVLFFKAKRWF